jgi:hypothetical protein
MPDEDWTYRRATRFTITEAGSYALSFEAGSSAGRTFVDGIALLRGLASFQHARLESASVGTSGCGCR